MNASRRWYRVAVFLLVASALLLMSGRYLRPVFAAMEHTNDLVRHNEAGDFVALQEDMDALSNTYDAINDRHLGFIANHLFADELLWQARYNYLTGYYEAVLSDLPDIKGDRRSHALRGHALFRQCKSLFAEGEQKEALECVTTQVCESYRRALTESDESRTEDAYNFDLACDPQSAMRAMQPQQGRKFKLGVPEGEGDEAMPGNQRSRGQRPGQGKPKRTG